jgi:hypothetical protein
MSGNQRGYTWLDEDVEHSDQDEARAKALASRWSTLHNEAEQRQFRRMADYESGYDYGPEACGDCEPCMAGDLVENCVELKEMAKKQLEKQAERDLEVELIEDKLEKLGARMMRPYEHWNEDERYVEYQERDRD